MEAFMPLALTNIYNQLTKQDQLKVSDFIMELFSKYNERTVTTEIKQLSKEDEEIFNYFTGKLSEIADPKELIEKNELEKYGI